MQVNHPIALNRNSTIQPFSQLQTGSEVTFPVMQFESSDHTYGFNQAVLVNSSHHQEQSSVEIIGDTSSEERNSADEVEREML